MTETNRSTLTSALSTGKEIKWTFDRELAGKYATGTAVITVRILDHAAELTPTSRGPWAWDLMMWLNGVNMRRFSCGDSVNVLIMSPNADEPGGNRFRAQFRK